MDENIQHVEGGDSPPLLCFGGTPLRVLQPAQHKKDVDPLEQIWRRPRRCSEAGASLLQRPGVVLPGEGFKESFLQPFITVLS